MQINNCDNYRTSVRRRWTRSIFTVQQECLVDPPRGLKIEYRFSRSIQLIDPSRAATLGSSGRGWGRWALTHSENMYHSHALLLSRLRGALCRCRWIVPTYNALKISFAVESDRDTRAQSAAAFARSHATARCIDMDYFVYQSPVTNARTRASSSHVTQKEKWSE